MAKLVAFYSRADENYFGGSMKYIQIGNLHRLLQFSFPSIECVQKFLPLRLGHFGQTS